MRKKRSHSIDYELWMMEKITCFSESTIFGKKKKKGNRSDKSIGCLFLKRRLYGANIHGGSSPVAPRNLKNSHASGHKSNEALDCIFNQHWFPEVCGWPQFNAGPRD